MQVERTDQQRRHHDAGHQRTGDDPASLPGRPQQRQGRQGATGTRSRHARRAPWRRARLSPAGLRAGCPGSVPARQQSSAVTSSNRLVSGRLPSAEPASSGADPARHPSASNARGAAAGRVPASQIRRSTGRRRRGRAPCRRPTGCRAVPCSSPVGLAAPAPAMASESTSMQAAPAPCRVRAAMSQLMEGPGRTAGKPAQRPRSPEQQATPPQTIPEPARHHRQTGDPKQVGHQHPLQAGEGHAEVLPQGRQHQVGHAARQHGQQGGEPGNPRRDQDGASREGNKKWCGHGSLSGK